MKEPSLLLVQELSSINNLRTVCSDNVINEMRNAGFFKKTSFTFIGVFYSYEEDITVIGYPKYMPKYPDEIELEEVIKHVSLVCKVIEQTKAYLRDSLVDTSNNFSEYINQQSRDYVDKYSLATFIMQDYIKNGVYFSKVRKHMLNVEGNVNWDRTVNSISPIIDKNILYLETMGSEYKADYSQLITSLHIWIINCCSKFLKALGQYQEVEIPEIIHNFQDEELKQYIPYIQKKITNVFSDREVHLLKSLVSWCGVSVFYQKQMGTTTFDRIWELATNKVFGNVNNTKSGNPIYCIDDVRYKAKGDSIPDILRVFSDDIKKQGYIGILDAKYYCPIINNEAKEIYRVPADSDISKQIAYYRYFKSMFKGLDIMFTNAFLLPKYEEDNETLYNNIGYAIKNDEINLEIEKLLHLRCLPTEKIDKVLLYEINPTCLYRYFLEDKKISNISFYNDFIVPF